MESFWGLGFTSQWLFCVACRGWGMPSAAAGEEERERERRREPGFVPLVLLLRHTNTFWMDKEWLCWCSPQRRGIDSCFSPLLVAIVVIPCSLMASIGRSAPLQQQTPKSSALVEDPDFQELVERSRSLALKILQSIPDTHKSCIHSQVRLTSAARGGNQALLNCVYAAGILEQGCCVMSPCVTEPVRSTKPPYQAQEPTPLSACCIIENL